MTATAIDYAGTVEEALLERYRADGAVCVRGAFAPAWIEGLRAAVDGDMAAPGPMARVNTPDGNPGLFFVDFQLWLRFRQARDFVFNSPAAALVARFMGARRVSFYHDHLLVKEPGTLEPTPWHHDQPYYPIDGAQLCSIWLPLDPVDADTCVAYVAGSHRWGRWFAPRYFRAADSALPVEDPRFEAMPDIDAERDRHRLLRWDMEPGDCIVFHALTVHGAGGNASLTRRRRAYATRWCGDDARYARRVGRTSPPIEGHGLAPGDPIASALFPPVWPAADAVSRPAP